MKKDIDFKVTFNSDGTEIDCYLCGEVTRNNVLYAWSIDKSNRRPKLGSVLACESCLSSSDIDVRIDRHAAQLDELGDTIRKMKGRMNMPELGKRIEADEISWPMMRMVVLPQPKSTRSIEGESL